MAKALKMASVGPVIVTIRSGQFPSEMLIRAPLCRRSTDGQAGASGLTQTLNSKREPTSSRIFFTVSPFCKRRRECHGAVVPQGAPHVVVCDKYLSDDAAHLLQEHMTTLLAAAPP